MEKSELLRRIQSNRAPVVLDTRSPMEFRRGHIPGALNAPVLKVLFKTAHLPADKNLEMVIVCGHGQRAWIAKKLLGLQGYRNMALLEGHMKAWFEAALPCEEKAS
jgi:hydroxyacylglutathione hydrolase